jgi:hypothetical protein
MMKGTVVTASRVNPRHVITRNSSFFKMLKVANNEGGSGGLGTPDEDNVSESEICANEQDDHLIGEAEDAVDNWVEDADEAVEQRQDDWARRQDVEAEYNKRNMKRETDKSKVVDLYDREERQDGTRSTRWEKGGKKKKWKK